MTRNKSLENIGVALLVVVTAVLGLAPGACAQSTYKTLYKFTKGQDGWFPDAGVIFDQAGNLYGTTYYGGDHGAGTVFKLTPNSDGNWTESVLYSFCSVKKCDDGSGPASDLIFDVVGNLYGTTYKGDPANAGTVFKLTPNPDGSWTESVLYSFCSVKKCAGRGGPTYAPLIFDAAGNLYGTTANDGAYGTGSVFELTPNSDGTWTERVLHSLVCNDEELRRNLSRRWRDLRRSRESLRHDRVGRGL